MRLLQRVCLIFLSLTLHVLAADFATCKIAAQRDENSTDPFLSKFFYRGPLAHFSNKVPRPLVLTLDGCKHYCGNSPKLNDVETSLIILTTWILPAIGLVSQLPFESLSVDLHKNFFALTGWIGTPASCLTAILFNLHATKLAADKSAKKAPMVDCYYVLSCLNQYEYYPLGENDDDDVEGRRRPSLATRNSRNRKFTELQNLHPVQSNGSASQHNLPVFRTTRIEPLKFSERTIALSYGLLRPTMNREEHFRRFKVASDATLRQLAHQLRVLRRRAVWPLVASSTWFAIASAISIEVAFGDLGDNTTAHSLALGLLLSWLPIMVLASVVDRNPIAAARCKVLIERWLDISYCLYQREKLLEINPSSTSPTSAEVLPFWEDGNTIVRLGEYLGQGRIPGYTGLTFAVVQAMQAYRKGAQDWNAISNTSELEQLSKDINARIPKRPLMYYICSAVSCVIVYLGVFMALLVSFNTPTVGLGCRSLMYTIFAALSFVPVMSDLLIAGRDHLYQTGSTVNQVRLWIFRIFGTLATIVLCLTALAQLLNFFNLCSCKVSTFGLGDSFGGHVDLENGAYYRENFDVRRYWGVGAGIGFASPLVVAIYLLALWRRTKKLWSAEEDDETVRDVSGMIPRDWLR